MNLYMEITESLIVMVVHFYTIIGERLSQVSTIPFLLLIVLTVMAVEGAVLIIIKNVMTSVFFALLRKIRKSKYLKRLAFRSVDNLEKILMAIDKTTQAKGERKTHGNRKNSRI